MPLVLTRIQAIVRNTAHNTWENLKSDNTLNKVKKQAVKDFEEFVIDFIHEKIKAKILQVVYPFRDYDKNIVDADQRMQIIEYLKDRNLVTKYLEDVVQMACYENPCLFIHPSKNKTKVHISCGNWNHYKGFLRDLYEHGECSALLCQMEGHKDAVTIGTSRAENSDILWDATDHKLWECFDKNSISEIYVNYVKIPLEVIFPYLKHGATLYGFGDEKWNTKNIVFKPIADYMP